MRHLRLELEVARRRAARPRPGRLAGSVRRQRHAAQQALSQSAQRDASRTWRSQAGVALSDDGKARAGMGVDAADFDNSGRLGLAVTNFDNEMIGLYRAAGTGPVPGRRETGRHRHAVAQSARLRLRVRRSRSRRPRSISSSPTATSTTPSATSAATSATRRRRCSFSIRATRSFREAAGQAGSSFAQAARRPRPRRRRLRSRRRRRSADDHQQRSGGAVPQRPEDRQPQPQAAPGRHHVESRRHRRHRPHLPRRHVTVADGEERIELPVPVRAAR